jgi:hypothetical protein
MPIPTLDPLTDYIPQLVRIVAATSWLPNPDTVRVLGCAIFPTARRRAVTPIFSAIEREGRVVGMYDDNTTPSWALLWSHGIVGGKRTGWTFAHIWPTSDDIGSYTALANLAMVPECLAGLTDKTGPLTLYLRWHAWSIYGWKPDSAPTPSIPEHYDASVWRYLPAIENPRLFVAKRIISLDNERLRILRPIMKDRGCL